MPDAVAMVLEEWVYPSPEGWCAEWSRSSCCCCSWRMRSSSGLSSCSSSDVCWPITCSTTSPSPGQHQRSHRNYFIGTKHALCYKKNNASTNDCKNSVQQIVSNRPGLALQRTVYANCVCKLLLVMSLSNYGLVMIVWKHIVFTLKLCNTQLTVSHSANFAYRAIQPTPAGSQKPVLSSLPFHVVQLQMGISERCFFFFFLNRHLSKIFKDKWWWTSIQVQSCLQCATVYNDSSSNKVAWVHQTRIHYTLRRSDFILKLSLPGHQITLLYSHSGSFG